MTEINREAKAALQAEMLYNRLSKRYRHLAKWACRTGTDAFRLYDRDIPEIPLVLDRYNDAVSGALYERPYEKDEDEENRWLELMAASVSKALDIPINRVFLKERRRQRRRQEGGAQYERIGQANVWTTVHESGARFKVNLSDYLDAGLFLDARKKRALLRSQAGGLRVLNLFAYTCSLSVCAALGGARQVDSVDLSNTYLDWGRVNFALNGLDAKNAGPSRFNFIRADVLPFLEEARRARCSWDLIILDPPSFSNSKKMKASLDIRRDYKGLIGRCLALLTLGGRLYFSSSAKGFRLPPEFPGFKIRDLQAALTGEDFKGKRTPTCYELTLDPLLS
ncbi:MAG: class I SAM-dependent methyltransferase [Treponema sp.]|jgi:23S rRNA G2069 N7-methylase RlmK/C1962 C5-methylase RlmI|nr:class I SAM-dependent methyltransferase [Treponema sp.]